MSTTVTVRLPPLVGQLIEMVVVVEAPVQPVGTVHENVFPPAPPLGKAVQVNGLPAVAVPHDTETVSGGVADGATQAPAAPVAASTCVH